jgi:predicted transcriptional regulator
VFATPVTEAEQDSMESAGQRRKQECLLTMYQYPRSSMAKIAEKLGWKTQKGDVNKRLVQRILDQLRREKLVEKRLDRYLLTERGRKAIRDFVPDLREDDEYAEQNRQT